MPPQKQYIKIEKEKLFLVEGADAYYFFIWACDNSNINDVQVMDFGGIDGLYLFLKALKNISGYEKVSTMLVARDAEGNANGAVESVKSALARNGLVVPQTPFEFAEGSPRIAYMVLPGFDSDSEGKALSTGTLEDLCLSMVRNNPVNECVDAYINCLESKAIRVMRPHKTRLHAYLAGKNEFVGMKIGEAAHAGAWDWEQPAFRLFRETIRNM